MHANRTTRALRASHGACTAPEAAQAITLHSRRARGRWSRQQKLAAASFRYLQCSRRMRCSSGSCTETVHARDIVAQSSARASTMHASNAPRIARLLLVDQAEPTLARVPWRHVERARVHTPAEGETPSPEHTLHAHPRCREAASSVPRAVCASSRHQEHPWPPPDDRRSRARSPGGQP